MRKNMILVALLAPSLMLGACGGTQNRGLESVHQPVVSRTDFVFDVNASRGGLAPGEGQRLAGWLASLKLGYGDHVSIDDPNAYGSGARDAVATQVARYGLLLSDTAPVSGAPVAPGTVRVIISRMKATVPGCPDFSRKSQPEFESQTSSNQGCAVNSNLAAMIADPVDLVRGRSGSGVTDADSASKAINVFRKATPTGSGGLKTEGTK